MRIACVYHPRQYLHGAGGKFHYVEQAFQNIGHETVLVQTLDELVEADKTCDLVLFEQRQPGSIDNNDIVKLAPNKRSLWFQWYFDITCYERDKAIQNQEWWPNFGPTMQAMDLVLMKERDRLREYRGNEINAVWFDQGCPSTMGRCRHYTTPEFDVIIWGQMSRWYQQRASDALTLAGAGYRIGWASNSGNIPQSSRIIRLPWCHVDKLPGLISQGAVSLHVDAFLDVDGFYSDRIWLGAGAGAINIRHMTLGQRALPGFGYNSPKVLLQLVDQLCKTPVSERIKLGDNARQGVMAQHTYEHRCREIVNYVNHLNGTGDTRLEGTEGSGLPTLQGDSQNQSPDSSAA